MCQNIKDILFFSILLKISFAYFNLLQEFPENIKTFADSSKLWHTFVDKFVEKMMKKHCISKQFAKLAENTALENCGGPSHTNDYLWCLRKMWYCQNITHYHANIHQVFDIDKKNYSDELSAVIMGKIDVQDYLSKNKFDENSTQNYKCHTLLQWVSLPQRYIWDRPGGSRWMRECLRLRRRLQKPTGCFLCNVCHIDLRHLYFYQQSPFDYNPLEDHGVHARLTWQLKSPHQ